MASLTLTCSQLLLGLQAQFREEDSALFDGPDRDLYGIACFFVCSS